MVRCIMDMVRNILVLAGIALAAFVFTLLFWDRKKEPDIGRWWDASGVPVFAFALIVLAAIAIVKGWFIPS